jgi:hypothetical protein
MTLDGGSLWAGMDGSLSSGRGGSLWAGRGGSHYYGKGGSLYAVFANSEEQQDILNTHSRTLFGYLSTIKRKPNYEKFEEVYIYSQIRGYNE